ncbi:MAG: hypothetical protein KatS3mg131_0718 [Candidatus Tectimicrobiota bacterium]|nr:MAG: hypothetical protein KatS3mg131_0718 [Candidatus Tectomicrobia bacterium]
MAGENTWRARLAARCTPFLLRRAGRAALLVGSLLVALNQGDVLLAGKVTGRVLLKVLLTPLIPFCVTLLGALAAPPRLGWAAVRRSLFLALVVGSAILALNQGDRLLAGRLTPGLVVKLCLTPCVPFAVSLYGAWLTTQAGTPR